MNGRALKIYFAGDLFDAKDLMGNLLLASAIEQHARGRYQIMLPQDGECEVADRSSQSIRDADFELLFSCDIILANFDGTDLDSGTVAEFCFAKMLDMPAVLLRTDFRDAGDHTLPDGEPWNLMCSHYPRTVVRHINAMEIYHQSRACAPDRCQDAFYSMLAAEIVAALDAVCAEKSWLQADELAAQYQRAIKSIGGSLSSRFPQERIAQIVAAKAAGGIYS